MLLIENVFICSYVVCTYANYCHVVSMQGVPGRSKCIDELVISG